MGLVGNNSANVSNTLAHPKVDKMDAFVTLNITLSVCIIAINLSVMVLFIINWKEFLSKPSQRFLLGLSICDFLSGVSVTLHVVISLSPFFEEANCKKACFCIRMVVDMFTSFLVTTAVMHLCFINVDRFISIFYALRYNHLVTKRTVTVQIYIAWFLPLLTSVIQATYLHPYFRGNPTKDEELQIGSSEEWYSVAAFIIYMVVPSLFNLILYILMFSEISKILHKTPTCERRVSARQIRVIKIFAAMYLCFSILNIPYFTMRLLIDLKTDVEITSTIFNLFYTFKSVTSLCNPILYCVLNREFRKSTSVWMRRRRSDINRSVYKLSVFSSQPTVFIGRRKSTRSSISEQERRDSGIFLESNNMLSGGSLLNVSSEGRLLGASSIPEENLDG